MNKKVLVISNNCFSKNTNNGKTYESIFIGTNKYNISQIYFTDNFCPDFDFCDDYFRIPDIDVFKGIFSKKNRVGGIINKDQFFLDLSISTKRTSKVKSFFSNKISLQNFCRDILWSSGSWMTLDLSEWSKKQNPDFIFFVAGSAKFSHKIAIYLSEFLNVPLVTYFTDDYLIYPKIHGFFDLIQMFRMKHFFKSTISKSSLCFAIGDIMCETYTRYFKRLFFPLMNSISVKKYIAKEINPDILDINYFGSIHTNRWKMLVKLANILNLPNRKNLKLNVYISNIPEKKILKSFSDIGINYKGSLFGEDLQNAIYQTDILLHIESNDNYSKSKTRLSVSTKIPEYLISGRPILGFGPKEVASMQLLSKNNIGVVICPADKIEYINSQLDKLILDLSFRTNLGKSGYDFAVKYFDNTKTTQLFYSKIEDMLNSQHNLGNIRFNNYEPF